jgi:hypothetical protein
MKGKAMSATKNTITSHSKMANDQASSLSAREADAVSEEALDRVSGGLNPQPLPPLERDSF